VISVAFDWASRYLALPAGSPGLAVDPPEEGGFGIGHKTAMAKNEGDIAHLKKPKPTTADSRCPQAAVCPQAGVSRDGGLSKAARV
jgi:hypothetical protein